MVWEAEADFISQDRLSEERSSGKEGGIYLPSSGKRNSFLLWLARPKEWENQKEVKIEQSISSLEQYEDKKNGNIIDFFDFSYEMAGKKQLKVQFALTAYEVALQETEERVKEYDSSSVFYREYTKNDRFLTQTEGIIAFSRQLTGKEKRYVKKAEKIYDWITENISFKETGLRRSVIYVFRKREGNMEEISSLFVTMCRAAGIPARMVSGAKEDDSHQQNFHLWSEFYLDPTGWVPVDCVDKLFGKLENTKTVISKGENIILERCPTDQKELGITNKKTFLLFPNALYLDRAQKGTIFLRESKYFFAKRLDE